MQKASRPGNAASYQSPTESPSTPAYDKAVSLAHANRSLKPSMDDSTDRRGAVNSVSGELQADMRGARLKTKSGRMKQSGKRIRLTALKL